MTALTRDAVRFGTALGGTTLLGAVQRANGSDTALWQYAALGAVGGAALVAFARWREHYRSTTR